MPRKSATLSTIFICYLLSTFLAFSLDIYLPSLPSILKSLHASLKEIQLTSTIFLFGFAFSQIFYGILVDYCGKRKSLLIGIMIYTTSSFACLLATTIQLLIFFRFIQAIGACSATISSNAIARDYFEEKQFTCTLANMAIMMTVIPSIAPLLGGMIDKTLGWRFNFMFLFCLGLIALILIYIHYKPAAILQQSASRLKNSISTYLNILLERNFFYNTIIASFTFTSLYFFLISSPFIFIHLSISYYTIILAINALTLIIGNQIAKLLTNRQSPTVCLIIGNLILFLGAILTLISINETLFIISIFICSIGIGILSPISLALSLKTQQDNSYPACALSGFLRFIIAMLISSFFPPTQAMTAIIFLFSAFTIFLCLQKLK